MGKAMAGENMNHIWKGLTGSIPAEGEECP